MGKFLAAGKSIYLFWKFQAHVSSRTIDVQMDFLYKLSLWEELGTLSLSAPEGSAKHLNTGL